MVNDKLMKKITIFALMLTAALPMGLGSCSKQDKKDETVKVYGRYVPERKDDFAWENEYAAFRLYGPALAAENPSNGVDLWLKASEELVVDSFYYREHVLGKPYHINYGKGLDCYKVGHTAGCGGLVVLSGEEHKLNIGGPYSTWRIDEQTPEKFVFTLHYDSLRVDTTIMQADVTITAEAGKLFNRADVVLTAPEGAVLPKLWVGGGIYMHDSTGAGFVHIEEGKELIAYAEDALSDKTAAQMNYDYNGSTDQGRSYISVITPGAKVQETITAGNDRTYVNAREYTPGDTLTYYFGACWSKYEGAQSFPTDEDWFRAVENEKW